MKNNKVLVISSIILGLAGLSVLVNTFGEDLDLPRVGLSRSSAENTLSGSSTSNLPYYNLSLVGLSGDQSALGATSSGNTIFIPLSSGCNVNLSLGNFQVNDFNCSDDGSANFQLPNPDGDNNGVTSYNIYIKSLTQAANSSASASCVVDSTGTWCPTGNIVSVRGIGQSSFKDVSIELLTVCFDSTRSGNCNKEIDTFDDSLANYLWSYSDNGSRLVQLRFYEMPDAVTQ